MVDFGLSIAPTLLTDAGRPGLRCAVLTTTPIHYRLVDLATGTTSDARRKAYQEYREPIDHSLHVPPRGRQAGIPVIPLERKPSEICTPLLPWISMPSPEATQDLDALRLKIQPAIDLPTRVEAETAVAALWDSFMTKHSRWAEKHAAVQMLRVLHEVMPSVMHPDDGQLADMIVGKKGKDPWDDAYTKARALYRRALAFSHQYDCAHVLRLMHANRSYGFTKASRSMKDRSLQERAAVLALAALIEATCLGVDALTAVNGFEIYTRAEELQLPLYDDRVTDHAWCLSRATKLLATATGSPDVLRQLQCWLRDYQHLAPLAQDAHSQLNLVWPP